MELSLICLNLIAAALFGAAAIFEPEDGRNWFNCIMWSFTAAVNTAVYITRKTEGSDEREENTDPRRGTEAQEEV